MKRKRSFTLVELLAAMFVFSILLTLSMQLFSSARQMWTNSERRTNAGTDARLAMDFIQLRLQLVSYATETPFLLPTTRDKVYFASAIPQERAKDQSQLRFYTFQVNSAGELLLGIYSDGAKNGNNVNSATLTAFSLLFPPYDRSTGYSTACTSVTNKLDSLIGDTTNTADRAVLLENVLALKFTACKKDLTADSTELTTPPYLLEIELKMLDSAENYKKYSELTDAAKKKEFEAEHAYIFRRMVTLTDYQVME